MCKLLVVDANHVDHMILQTLFSHFKLFEDNCHSEDGKSSWNSLWKNRANEKDLPDLILLDLYMPNFSGWDFLSKFNRAYSAFKKKIDIVITSTSINPEDMERSKSYPFIKGFFIKPLSIETLEELNNQYNAKEIHN
jgi:response regulator of citrate/malate metabolism